MIGERLGKWVIFKELGHGGMGRVFLAQEELTGRQCAIKVLGPELAQEVGFLHRFQREIETLSQLDHCNIVRFYESGHENGHYFYAMEYVDGRSLEQIVATHGRMDWRDVLGVALQVVPALKHIHDHGIIHRDIKPSNLILSNDGIVKLMDFGIAKVFAGTRLTATGGIVGTAEFLSPEQAAGKVVGKRSDLYCLGCVLYALLIAKPPFSGMTYVELLHKHRYAQFDSPRRYIAELPRELDELICQLLEKDPEKRPRDASVLQRQIETLAKKLERHATKTSADNKDISTIAENRVDKLSSVALPGPGTFAERNARGQGGHSLPRRIVEHLSGQAIGLFLVMLLCIGTVAWAFWPLGQDQLFTQGVERMDRGSLYDMHVAWRDYFDPLDKRFPEHPYKEQLVDFRERWEAAKANRTSEAQRFFQAGESLKQQGKTAEAKRLWVGVIDVFQDSRPDAEWVRRAKTALCDLENADHIGERLKDARVAMKRAANLKHDGKLDDARRIWNGIVTLYQHDPAANEIVAEARKAMKEQRQ